QDELARSFAGGGRPERSDAERAVPRQRLDGLGRARRPLEDDALAAHRRDLVHRLLTVAPIATPGARLEGPWLAHRWVRGLPLCHGAARDPLRVEGLHAGLEE